MTERPILFSAPMVRAILEGRKTQTRRVVFPQPMAVSAALDPSYKPTGKQKPGAWMAFYSKDQGTPFFWARSEFGQPGDRLWVRETFAVETTREWPRNKEDEWNYVKRACADGRPHYLSIVAESFDGGEESYYKIPHYRATDPEPQLVCESEKCAQCPKNDFGSHWRPSIHMPRWACRLVLEITDVRVERLHEIVWLDAKDEGVQIDERAYPTQTHVMNGYRREFYSLWHTIHAADGPQGWNANPWVWVITFKRIQP